VYRNKHFTLIILPTIQTTVETGPRRQRIPKVVCTMAMAAFRSALLQPRIDPPPKVMVAKDVEQMQRPNDRGGRHLLGEAIYTVKEWRVAEEGCKVHTFLVCISVGWTWTRRKWIREVSVHASRTEKETTSQCNLIYELDHWTRLSFPLKLAFRRTQQPATNWLPETNMTKFDKPRVHNVAYAVVSEPWECCARARAKKIYKPCAEEIETLEHTQLGSIL